MKKGFNQVAVIGAGTMGHGLALLFALGGSAVRLVDISQERLDRAMELIRSHLSGLNLHREYDIEMEKVLQLIVPEPGLGDRISGSDFIVDAIVEKADAKRALFHELGRRAGAGSDATLNNIQGEPIHLASGADHSPALERLVDAGHYGVKTGRGFFDWSGRDLTELLQERDLRLLQVRKRMKQWE